ncbi:MAG: YceI family protein [Cyclonatronaceae bacterium]
MSRNHAILIPCILLLILACNRSESHQATDAVTPGVQTGVMPLPAASDASAPTIQSRFITKSGYTDFSCLALGTIGIFTGHSERLNGTLDLSGNQLDFSLDIRSLKTGIARRDRDLYKVFDADQHPKITFSGSFQPDFDPDSIEKQPVTATGIFNLHGVDRELVVDGFLQRTGNSIQLEADFQIDIRDFGVNPPEVFLVQVNGQPELHISARLVPELLANSR